MPLLLPLACPRVCAEWNRHLFFPYTSSIPWPRLPPACFLLVHPPVPPLFYLNPLLHNRQLFYLGQETPELGRFEPMTQTAEDQALLSQSACPLLLRFGPVHIAELLSDHQTGGSFHPQATAPDQ